MSERAQNNEAMEELNNAWGEDWVSEPQADYSSFTKGQFLDDIERRLKLFMLRCVKVCLIYPKTTTLGTLGNNSFGLRHRPLLTFALSVGDEVKRNTLPNSA